MKIRLSSDDRVGLLLAAFISFEVWMTSLNGIIYLPVFNIGLATYLCVFLYAAIIACALPIIWKRINYTDVLVLLLISVVLIYSYLLFPNTHERMSERLIYFFQALPWLFVGRGVSDYRLLLSWFKKAARVTIILGVLYYIIRIANPNVYNNGQNNMVFAYKFLPSCIVILYDLVKNVNIKNIFFTIAGISVLILCGCRGAILCFGAALAIFVYFFASKRWYKIAATFIFAAAAMFFISNYFYSAMVFFNRHLQTWGIDNRIFKQILANEFSDGSGRDVIAAQVLQGIAKQPFLGYGLYGDANLNIFGLYSHNIVLELMASFGILIGIFLFLALVINFFKIVTSTQFNEEYKIVLITFFCAGVVKLFMSGSFMDESYLWLMIGMMAGNKKVIVKAIESENKYGVKDGKQNNHLAVQ